MNINKLSLDDGEDLEVQTNLSAGIKIMSRNTEVVRVTIRDDKTFGKVATLEYFDPETPRPSDKKVFGATVTKTIRLPY